MIDLLLLIDPITSLYNGLHNGLPNSLGASTPRQWLDLADALLRKTPPDTRHALDAAWQNYIRSDNETAAIAGLLAMAKALRAMDRQDQAALTLEQVVKRAPNDARFQAMLADARRAVGLIVLGVRTKAEADPPRACIAFSVPPTTRGDFNAQDGSASTRRYRGPR